MTEPRRTRSGERPKGPVLLFVEDMTDVRVVLAEVLVREGFVVVEAKNGREAIAKAQSLRPHVIVMDVTLPLLGGVEAARIIRATEGMRDVPIIALTAQALDAIDRGAFDAIVTKPCVPDVLVWRLRAAMAERERRIVN